MKEHLKNRRRITIKENINRDKKELTAILKRFQDYTNYGFLDLPALMLNRFKRDLEILISTNSCNTDTGTLIIQKRILVELAKSVLALINYIPKQDLDSLTNSLLNHLGNKGFRK